MSHIDNAVASAIAGERRALAEILTWLEIGGLAHARAIKALKPHLRGATVIGITGPPGAGKSTLVDRLILAYRAVGRRVAVIAVDPSSPVSGGAILGDRVRMQASAQDDGVFIRSLASRGALGGLSPAAIRLIDGLDAAGYDPILVETVGTGQNEIDVAAVADVRVVLAAPNLGDGIQAMKAGLLEIADVLVVNKADLPGADATVEQLKAAQRLSGRADGASRPVLKTSSATGTGIEELSGVIDEEAAARRKAQVPEERRMARLRFAIETAIREVVASALEQGALDPSATARVAMGELGLEAVVAETLAQIASGQKAAQR